MTDIWEKSERVWKPSAARNANRFGFDLKLTLVLSLLREFTELSGYSLHKKIKERSGVDLSYGSIYPMMYMLLRQNLVKSRLIIVDSSPMRRRVYTLTELGESELNIMLSFLKRLHLVESSAAQLAINPTARLQY